MLLRKFAPSRLLFGFLLCGVQGLVYAQAEKLTTREKVEEASYAYPAQVAGMDRYLAVVTVAKESQYDDMSSMSDGTYRYALSRGKTLSDDKVRIESGSFLEASNGGTDDRRYVRRLKLRGHDWVGMQGHYGDYFEKPDDGPTRRATWDPITMPINYYAATSTDTSRQVINHIMPAGHLFKTEIDGVDRRVGYWRHGLKQDLGMTKVIFDPKVGNMPTEMVMRDFKFGESKLNEDSPEKNTVFRQKNETKWFKHRSGNYLPQEVRCIDVVRKNTSGWKLTYQWWIGDEVPDEVFTVDDLRRADSGTSVVDELVEKRRLELKAKEAKAKKSASR
ncbi:MAG: hypothetical protein Aurels2KO_19770 [Aureliella sp.]